MFSDEMKYKHKSVIFAQCDAHVTSCLVQRDDVHVQSMVDKKICQ